jgi:predicted metal-dependent enzyme (double-stranded beta helix superfamily)
MTPPILETFVERARAAAASDTPKTTIRDLLQSSLSESDAMADAIASLETDEVMFFEDETCSIWACRFDSDVVLAPHEHCMPVHIAVYRGTEVEVLYKREPDHLKHGGNKLISAGEVASLGTDAIHAITADGTGQSLAIHIYQGPLTAVKRSLFDWESGAEVDFTVENFYAMRRLKSDMEEFK